MHRELNGIGRASIEPAQARGGFVTDPALVFEAEQANAQQLATGLGRSRNAENTRCNSFESAPLDEPLDLSASDPSPFDVGGRDDPVLMCCYLSELGFHAPQWVVGMSLGKIRSFVLHFRRFQPPEKQYKRRR
jgi:hypothetical protein